MTIYEELEQHCQEIVRIANICYPSQQADSLDSLKPLVEATLQKLQASRPFVRTKVEVVVHPPMYDRHMPGFSAGEGRD